MSKQPPSTSFQRALEKFKQSLPPKLLQDFQEKTLKDVSQTICAIEARHGSDGTLRGMERMHGFLEAMDQYRKVIESFLNCTPFLGYVWIVETEVTSLETILEAYEDIGEQIPAFMQYQTLFERYPQLRRTLELYFCDILEFHRHALDFLNKPGWKRFFKSFWKTFDTKFKSILDSLKRHKDLIESEKDTAALFEVQRAREVAETHYQEQSARETKRQLNAILEKLNAASYQSDHFAACAQRKNSTSGQWITKNDVFTKWSNPNIEGKANLFINGVPGAGKTILASYLIYHLSEKEMANVLYFYCKHDQQGKNNLTDALRALLSQLVRQDDIIIGYVHDACVSKDLLDPMSIRKTAAATLCGRQNIYIVLDGVDECDPDDAEEIIEWFLGQQKSAEGTDQGEMRLLCIGQRTDVLQRKLGDAAHIPLENTKHSEDVDAYIERQARKIMADYEISEAVTVDLVKRVSFAANGMFLFAKLVMENLQSQTNQMDVMKELEPRVFPVDVKDAYERVVATVFNGGPQQNAATQILGWVLCAKRPLRWREIQATFFLDIETGTSNYEGRRLRKGCKRLCGSLIDLHEEESQMENEAVLHLVHESARFYLIQNRLVSTRDEETKISLYCTKYLLTWPFRAPEAAVIDQNIKDGYYSLQDYVASYWIDHLRACLRQNTHGYTSTASDQTLTDQTRLFLDHYKIALSDSSYGSVNGANSLGRVDDLPHDVKAKNAWKALESSVLQIRVAMELKMSKSQMNDDQRQRLVTIYGPLEFKCPKIGCNRFQSGFRSGAERDEHLKSHDRQFCCAEGSCAFHVIGFETQERLERHIAQAHRKADDESVVEFPKPPRRNDTLHKAASRGDLLAVKSLIADGHDINERSTRKPRMTPLMLAIANEHVPICKLLIHEASFMIEKQPSGMWGYLINVLELVYQSDNGPMFEVLLSLPVKLDHPRHVPPGNSKVVQTLKKNFRSKKFRLDERKKELSTWLPAAGANGDFELLEWLLEEVGVSPNRFVNGQTALYGAAVGGHVDAVKLLISRADITVNYTPLNNKRLMTPLMAAIKGSHEGVVRALLDADGIEVPTHSTNGEPTLCEAVKNGNISIVQMLLQTGNLDVNAANTDEESPLLIAADRGQGAIISLLLASPYIKVNCKDHLRQTPLCAAARRGHIEALSALLQNSDIDVNASDINNQAPLRIAAERGHAQIVNMLLSMPSVDVNSIDSHRATALLAAASHGYEEVVQSLLSAQSLDPNARRTGGKTAIVQAVLNGYTRITALLVADPRVDLDGTYKGDTLLMLATFRLNADIAMKMIELVLQAKDPRTRPLFLNTRNEVGKTVLRCAVEREFVEVMKYLIGSHGIEVDTPDNLGQTPLWWAVSFGNLTVIGLLLDHGLADPNKPNELGDTAVEAAIRRGRKDTVQFLSRSGKVDRNQLSGNDKVTFDRLVCTDPSVDRANQLTKNSSKKSNPLHDFQMQLMLLEQQNKKRLLMERD